MPPPAHPLRGQLPPNTKPTATPQLPRLQRLHRPRDQVRAMRQIPDDASRLLSGHLPRPHSGCATQPLLPTSSSPASVELLPPFPRTLFFSLPSLILQEGEASPAPTGWDQTPLEGLSLILAWAHIIMAACSSHQERGWRARLRYSRPSGSCKCSQIQRGTESEVDLQQWPEAAPGSCRHRLPHRPHTL